MRTWGRVPSSTQEFSSAIGEFVIGQSPIGSDDLDYVWTEVTTDENGYNDAVWLTTLAQVLQLNPGESPMFGNYGVPSQQAVVGQVPPTINVMRMQQIFAQYFVALIVSRNGDFEPTYAVNATAHSAAILQSPVPI